jgi:type IV pilus assembly protein PilV
MIARRTRQARPRAAQAGVMLLEALIAIVIFSIGILALIGLQAASTGQVSESKMRSDASFIADKVIGDLAAGTVLTNAALRPYEGTYTATAVPGGADPATAADWQALLAQNLPGGSITLTIPATANAADPSAVTIVVGWQTPLGPRNFRQTAMLVDS